MQPLLWCFYAHFRPASAPSGLASGSSLPVLCLLTQRLIDPPTHRPKLAPLQWRKFLALSSLPQPPLSHHLPRIYARKTDEKTPFWSLINPPAMQKGNRYCGCLPCFFPLVPSWLGGLVLICVISVNLFILAQSKGG